MTLLRFENSQNIKMATEVIASTFREFSKRRNVMSRSKSLLPLLPETVNVCAIVALGLIVYRTFSCAARIMAQ